MTTKNKSKTTEWKFNGSWGIIVLWCILCFPIAIVYYFMKSEHITKESDD